jgi:DNA mismatch repair ATPase MutS
MTQERVLNFYRRGDYYEATNDDARVVADLCGYTLNQRRDGTPLCAVPAWSCEAPFAELEAAGYKVVMTGGVRL